MIHRRPATSADVSNVLDQLSRRSSEEIRALGLKPSAARQQLIDRFRRHGADAIMQDGQVVAIFGHYREPGYREIWFLAKEAFLGRNSLRFTRHYISRLVDNYPGTSFRYTSRLNRPEIARWFEFLGFRCLNEHWISPVLVQRTYEIGARDEEPTPLD